MVKTYASFHVYYRCISGGLNDQKNIYYWIIVCVSLAVICDGVSLLSHRSRSRGRAQADDEDSMDATDATLPPEMGERRTSFFLAAPICRRVSCCVCGCSEKRKYPEMWDRLWRIHLMSSVLKEQGLSRGVGVDVSNDWYFLKALNISPCFPHSRSCTCVSDPKCTRQKTPQFKIPNLDCWVEFRKMKYTVDRYLGCFTELPW